MSGGWSTRSRRERRVLLTGLLLGVLIPTSALLWTILEDTAAIEARVAEKRQWIAVYRARPVPLATSRADQRLTDTLRAAGVEADRFSLSPTGSGGLQLTLRAAPFDAVMAALARSGAPGPAIRMQVVAAGAGRVDGSLEFAPSP